MGAGSVDVGGCPSFVELFAKRSGAGSGHGL